MEKRLKSFDDHVQAAGIALDPLTAGLQALNAIIALITTVIEGQPADVREALWRMHVEDVKAWRTFLQSLHPGAVRDTREFEPPLVIVPKPRRGRR